MEDLHDFGTGLRAHLGLEEEVLELLAQSAHEPDDLLDEAILDDVEAETLPDDGSSILETLIAFEHELLVRERELARREQKLAARADGLLAAAQSLHDEVVGSTPTAVSLTTGDELARMRRRKSGAA
jgi:hypothetical protein